MDGINIHTNDIAHAMVRWVRNRDFIEGEDRVKQRKERYLPPISGMTPSEYNNYLLRTPFFPGAARTHDGMKGLVFRKQPLVQVPQGLEKVFDTITHDGHSVEDLAEDIFDETLVTNFTGMLVDVPDYSPQPSDTLSASINTGIRPFIAVYPAEHILEVTARSIGNIQKLVRVRLLDDECSVRELILDDHGVYRQIMHSLIETKQADGKLVSEWVQADATTPMKDGRPLDFIPFILASTKARAYYPVKGPLDDLVRTNHQLYLEQADAKNSRYYSSAPVFYIMGATLADNVTITPGTVLQFPDSRPEAPVTLGFAEFSGAGQATLEKAVQTLKDEMALLGSRIIAPDGPHAEAAETASIRRASENATLAAITRAISRKIKEALDLVSWWMNVEQVQFELSTDFLPMPLQAQEIQVFLSALQSGQMSVETFYGLLVSGEILPTTFDVEEEKQRIQDEAASLDRPAGPPVNATYKVDAGVHTSPDA